MKATWIKEWSPASYVDTLSEALEHLSTPHDVTRAERSDVALLVAARQEECLGFESPLAETEPTNYWLTMLPLSIACKVLIRLIKLR